MEGFSSWSMRRLGQGTGPLIVLCFCSSPELYSRRMFFLKYCQFSWFCFQTYSGLEPVPSSCKGHNWLYPYQPMNSALNAWRGIISDSSLIQGEIQEDWVFNPVSDMVAQTAPVHLLGFTPVKLLKFSVFRPICNLDASCVYWEENISSRVVFHQSSGRIWDWNPNCFCSSIRDCLTQYPDLFQA